MVTLALSFVGAAAAVEPALPGGDLVSDEEFQLLCDTELAAEIGHLSLQAGASTA